MGVASGLRLLVSEWSAVSRSDQRLDRGGSGYKGKRLPSGHSQVTQDGQSRSRADWRSGRCGHGTSDAGSGTAGIGLHRDGAWGCPFLSCELIASKRSEPVGQTAMVDDLLL